MSKELAYWLDKCKYFGLRFVYYRLKKRFPSVKPFIHDITNPKLTSKFISDRLIRIYNGEQGHGVNEKERDFIGLGLLHYSILRMIKPKRVLCVGSLRGFIPAICALACEDNEYGHVDFVDAGFDDNNLKSWGNDGFWKKVEPKQHFNQLKLNRISSFIMTNKAFKKKYKNRKYQYIYIDGDHTYQGVKLDYQLFWPMLEKNGYMSFHDILGTGEYDGAEFGVKKFWQELPDKHKIEMLFPVQSGLGILQKK